MKLSTAFIGLLFITFITRILLPMDRNAYGQASDASTPLDAIRLLNDAFVHNDPDKLSQTDAPVAPDELEFVSAEKALLLAKGKIDAAYFARFPASEKATVPPSILSGPVVPVERVAAAVISTIDDHTADVAIPQGMHYIVARIDGKWRIQVARSIASVYPLDPAKALRGLAATFRGVAAVFDSTTREIQTGALATPEAVNVALKARLEPVYAASDAALPPRSWTDLPNPGFVEQQESPGFTVKLDPGVKHYDQPALLLASANAKPTVGGNAGRSVDVTPLRGKRVRFAAFLKSKDVTGWGGLSMVAIADTGKWLAFDTMSNQISNSKGVVVRAISGTTDWQERECVADIPITASRIMVGMQLYGSGQLWLDDARIEIVGQDIPTTDDQNPHLYSAFTISYSMAMDKATLRDGHATLCVSLQNAPYGAHAWYGLVDREPKQYLGRKVRLSAWMKCEGECQEHLSLVAAMPGRGPDPEIDNEAGRPANRLTPEWQHFEVTGDLPATAQCLTQGNFLFGNGKVWIDDMKVEVIDLEEGGW